VKILHQLLSLRVQNRQLSLAPYLTWCLVACLALTLLPTALGQGIPVWEFTPGQLMQAYVSAIAFLTFALILFYAARAGDGISIFLAAILGAACLVLAAGILLLNPELEYSRRVLLLTGGAGILLALYPLVVSRPLFVLLFSLLFIVQSAVFIRILLLPPVAGAHITARVQSSLYVLEKTVYEDIPNEAEVEGGAIERLNDGFIAVTGDGQFYQLDWSPVDGRLVFTRLPLASPLLGRDEFFADPARAGLQFRVTDLLFRASDQGNTVFAAHQSWGREGDCFRMGLSRARLPAITESASEPGATWTTIYRTHPCIARPFDTVETGGRLAWFGPDKILMTVGDHGYDGVHHTEVSQEPGSDYGKVLLLDMHGGAQVFTSGHRNPQGLLIDNLGQPWETEHGPAGGDELNLLVAGNNYGWPLVTYGTDYYKLTWPLNPDAKNHGVFTEPVFVFVPSVAISNLIQLSGKQFPRWQDDFLVGSLRKQTLYRFRIRDNRVAYAEPILLGKEIRDLVAAPDGRVLVWSDDESVTVLSRYSGPSSGEDTFKRCRRCHEPSGNAAAIAPNLEGIVGREIASSPDYAYSPALHAVDGAWSEKRLMEFLADPQAFAPGTAMGGEAVPDDGDRAALVEFLKTYGAATRR